MRTTISIDQGLLRRAKSISAANGETLSALIEDALRERLERVAPDAKGDHRPLLVIHKEGGVHPGINLDKTSELLGMLDELDASNRH